MTGPRRWLESLTSAGRFLAVVAAVIVAGTVVADAWIITRTADRLAEDLDRELVAEASTTRLAIAVLSPDQLETFAAADIGRRDTALVTIGADGTVVSALPSNIDRRGEPDPLPSLPDFDELEGRLDQPFTVPAEDGDGEYRVVATRLEGGGVIAVAAPTAPLDDVIDSLVRTVTIAGAVTLAVVVVLVVGVTVVARGPVDRLIEAAEQIGDGDLEARVSDIGPSRDARRLAHALNNMAERLRASAAERDRSESALRDFAANASHELRTPLTSIRGYAELLRTGAVSDPEVAVRAVERIESESARMGRLVDELLLLARLDEARPMHDEAVDLGAVVSDAVDDARASATGHILSVRTPDQALIVRGDEDRLRQAVSNLLTNAVTHTPAGTTVEARVSAADARAMVSVTDDGPGIPLADREHVFDRFWRPEAARSRTTGGTGLGLAVVASIASAHGGEVSVDSSPTGGTTFVISLPC